VEKHELKEWRKASAAFLFGVLIMGPLIFMITTFLAGYSIYRDSWFINVTPSMPKGLYRLSSKECHRGDAAGFCLNQHNPWSSLAAIRGYLGKGSCPSGLKPLLKFVAGLEGDLVEVTAEGVAVNGSLLPNSVRLEKDSQGRSLPPSILEVGLTSGPIPFGQALMVSSHPAGFDSRHFGLVSVSALRRAEPIFTF